MKKPVQVALFICLLLTLPACAVPAMLSAATPTAASTIPPTRTSTPVATQTSTLPPAPTAPPMPTPLPTLSREVLGNFTYWLTDFNTTADLKDGLLDEQKDPSPGGLHLRGRMVDPIAQGDLNGDGLPDAAVVLAINTGGSGTFFYLVVVLNQQGSPVQGASDWFGDRQAVKDLQIKDGKINLDFITQSPEDPLCCPSQHRLRSYQLENGMLQIVSDEVVN